MVCQANNNQSHNKRVPLYERKQITQDEADARRAEVHRLAAQGLIAPRIAERIGISPELARFYMRTSKVDRARTVYRAELASS